MLLTFSVLGLCLAPLRFALLIALPWILGMESMLTMNLWQHDGCDPTTKLTGSRNFVSPFANWFFFNNGFHTVHHLSPNLHWSQAPAFHAKRVKTQIAPELDQRSLALWGLRWLMSGPYPTIGLMSRVANSSVEAAKSLQSGSN